MPRAIPTTGRGFGSRGRRHRDSVQSLAAVYRYVADVDGEIHRHCQTPGVRISDAKADKIYDLRNPEEEAAFRAMNPKAS
jgi:hypothetical protein